MEYPLDENGTPLILVDQVNFSEITQHKKALWFGRW
ncbi:hypothetical protein ACT3UM_04210 [Halomonas sp. AOP13-D3-9]